ncbi:chemokine XC receptor 1-like [Acanthochromis polyacanthus]|uniref:chemokine XC receptor 1-like n=1 Tax=Acanthochromis polyacanthus TaxID=80966 RepID=UPI002234A053|nr:chemokine XC receptor 1-like [Acanthochromis polyacanthus]
MATTDSDYYYTETGTTGITETYHYDYYTEDEVCDKSDVVFFGAIFTPVFFSFVVIFSLLSNILVIVVLVKYENLKSLTNAFILNLAVSDLFFTAGLPFWIYYHMYGWTLGEPACKIVNFIFYIGFYSSGFLLILMTIHRYVAVMKPLSNIVSTTGLYSIVASAIIWVVSILVASPALLCTKVVDSQYCVYENSYWRLWGTYQQNAIFILSSVIFVFCYSQIMCRLLRPTVQRRRNKTLKLIFILMVVFFVGWLPYNVVLFLQSLYWWPQTATDAKTLAEYCEASKRLDYAFYISRFFAFSHCCLNPVFYVFVGVKFNSHLKKMLKSWGHKQNSVRSRHSRLTITSQTSGEELSI